MGGCVAGAIAAAIDAIWPRRCAAPGCGAIVDRPGRLVCSACLARLPFIDGPVCPVCGRSACGGESGAAPCGGCLETRPAFDAARSAARHEGAVRSMLLDFKFRARFELKEDLVDLLEGALDSNFDRSAVDVVVPVPLHPLRRLARGFNQSAMLAEGLALRIGRRYDAHGICRLRDTGHQSRLGAAARRRNMDGAFGSKRPWSVAGRTVLLVDDVATTGATLDACAAALVKAGAWRVWALTVSRR